MQTSFISLTELWSDCRFIEVGNRINSEQWAPKRVAEFCAYFCKYMGTRQLEILYKFI